MSSYGDSTTSMIARELLIEAVTVCIDYSDFLREVLPHNLPHLDAWTVVTAPHDGDTQRLCKQYGVRCLVTDVMYRDATEPAFNKSRAINHGLAHMEMGGWVIHLDADVALPPYWRKMVANAEIDEKSIYGFDRVDCRGSIAWDDFLDGDHLQYEWSCLVKSPPGMKLGARIAHGDYGGYVPIGFAQLWNPKGSGINRYPVKQSGDMEHSDVLHAIQWPRGKRVLLPEAILVHLESHDVKSENMGVNWKGRKSAPFRAK